MSAEELGRDQNLLGMIAKKRGLYTQAEAFYRVWAPCCLPVLLSRSFICPLQQALTAFDRSGKTYGVSTVLCNLGDLARKQERYETAIELYNRALGIVCSFRTSVSCFAGSDRDVLAELQTDLLGSSHPALADVLANIALVRKKLAQYDESEKLYRRVLALTLGVSLLLRHP